MLYVWLARDFHAFGLVNLYGIGVALAILSGFFIARYMAKRRNIAIEIVEDFIFLAAIVGIVFARLLFVLLNLDYYLASPGQILAFWQGGLSIHGAILGGLITAIFYCRKHGISFGNLADVMTPALVFGEAIGRLGCDVVGRATSSAPLAFRLGGQYYHNVPLYTFLALMVIGFWIWKSKDHLVNGRLFVTYLFLYAISRLGIDYFRQGAVVGQITVAQLGSLVVIIITFFLYKLLSNKGRPGLTI